jgi:uncharacterized protein (UPF0335 family)
MGKMESSIAAEGSGTVRSTAAEELRSYVDRVRRIKEEIKERNADVADLYGAASSAGFDKRVLKVLVKRLDSDPAELENLDNLLALYEAQYHAKQSGQDA